MYFDTDTKRTRPQKILIFFKAFSKFYFFKTDKQNRGNGTLPGAETWRCYEVRV